MFIYLFICLSSCLVIYLAIHSFPLSLLSSPSLILLFQLVVVVLVVVIVVVEGSNTYSHPPSPLAYVSVLAL
ncbi:hypothetical protein BKA81DRAFT_354010 [Phyllosticta paracitricarpa]